MSAENCLMASSEAAAIAGDGRCKPCGAWWRGQTGRRPSLVCLFSSYCYPPREEWRCSVPFCSRSPPCVWERVRLGEGWRCLKGKGQRTLLFFSFVFVTWWRLV
jgi:hypothetical protein